MNSSTLNERPLWTPFNQKPVRTNADTRRVLVNGRWQKVDQQASSLLRWLKGGN